MKVGDLVTRRSTDTFLDDFPYPELGIVTDTTHHCERDDLDPDDSVWVRWNGNVDWDMEWPSELRVLNSVG